jgi:ankyrin repeat protein
MMVRSAAAARVLLDAGADPFVANTNGFSVWHTASYLGPELAELLIKAGLPPDTPAGPGGETALWFAACRGNAGVVATLLAAGARTATSGSRGLSPVDCAREGQASARGAREPDLHLSDTPPPFVPDFDRTLKLLEEALTRGRKH